MGNVLWVGLGGFLGSILRYWIGGLVNRLTLGSLIPFGTLAVNVLGCLALGFLAGIFSSDGFPTQTRLFLFIGLLGGFTTYSTFGYESFHLLQESLPLYALANVLLQVVLGVGGVWAGHLLSKAV
jgi:CrcB protein